MLPARRVKEGWEAFTCLWARADGKNCRIRCNKRCSHACTREAHTRAMDFSAVHFSFNRRGTDGSCYSMVSSNHGSPLQH